MPTLDIHDINIHQVGGIAKPQRLLVEAHRSIAIDLSHGPPSFPSIPTIARAMNGAPIYCPLCGERNKANAVSCKGCGADERTGFFGEADETLYDESDDFDYEDFVEKEFGTGRKPTFGERRTALVALILIAILILAYLF